MPYIGRSLGDGVRARYIYAATSGQTSFSGNDANGIALAYSDTLYMDVYQNGVLLKPVTDYASTTGTSVVLTTGASTSDVVEMIVYDSFAVADTVSAVNGGTFTGNMAMGGTLGVTGTTTIGNGTSGVAKINGGSSSSGQLIFMDAGTNRARIGVPTGTTTLSLSGSNTLTGDVVITADGEVTMPTQPCFAVTSAGNQNNIAINSDVTVVLDTEIFDVGANFASNTFTAPVTGKYQLNASVRVQALDSAAAYYYVLIKTSNRNYAVIFDPDFGQDAAFWSFANSALADMDANDTAFVLIQQSGGTAQTDIVYASTWTFFNGALIC
tara:strand:+ start:1118 stop:2092 length:975 start_codon:yes stop_codon:yes gene_type:complete